MSWRLYLTPLLFLSALLYADEEPLYTDDLEVDPPFDHYMPPTPPEPPPQEKPEEITVNLKDPLFKQGVISTDKGGIVSAPGFRVQAQKIEYTNKIENGVRIQKIAASGDLMMEYGDRAFVGDSLEYDFIEKTGTLLNGKTFVDMWFLGGERIELRADGTYCIYNAFVTTCESQENTWEIKARDVQVTQEHLLTAKDIRFQFFKIPLLWIPKLSSNLQVFSDPPIRYKVIWDKGLGPRVTMRYRLFSIQNLDLFFRLDYRIDKGPGGAIESEYFSPDDTVTFVTRNYIAHDKIFPNERGYHRYRIQGLYHQHSKDEKTQLHATWDKLSDTRMVGDFRSDDFEINTEKRTRLLITHEASRSFINVSVQPRINNFQSIDQQLPLSSLGIRPFQLGHSGIIATNYVSAGYLDYVYAKDLTHQFHLRDLRTSTKSGRLETRNQLYRACSLGPLTVTPNVGILGIFYSNSPTHHSIGQGMLTYGFKSNLRLWGNYSSLRHLIEPYMTFEGLTTPLAGTNQHFYFDIQDGYHQLNQLRIGVRNLLFKPRSTSLLPFLYTDLYTNSFFGHKAFGPCLPKYYFNLVWNLPTFALRTGFAWNQEERLWDYTNIATDWTINEDIAFGIEFRHRSRFDWRKANHQNFIVDVTRPIDALLDSPLSDQRNTLLTRFFVRLTPKWHCQFQTRHGWGRANEPAFHASKFDFVTKLTCSWSLRLSYEHLPNDDRFSIGTSLLR